MSKSPRVFITGLSNSGTTWALDLLLACGLDGGTGLVNSGPRNGKEWPPVQQLAADFQQRYFVASDIEQDALVAEYRERIEALDCPDVVKLPWGPAFELVLDALNPAYTIVLTRPLEDRTLSLMTGEQFAGKSYDEVFNWCAMEFGYLMNSVEHSELPYVTLPYPKSARDVEFAYERVVQAVAIMLPRFEQAHKDVTQLDWIDYSARNA